MRNGKRGLWALGLTVIGAMVVVTSLGVPCNGGDQPGSSAMIGAKGGSLTHGGARLDIPAGALPADTLIRISTSLETPPDGYNAHSDLLYFEPSGLAFALPVKITWTIDAPAETAIIFWSEGNGGTFAPLPTARDGLILTADVQHFSGAFVADPPATCTAANCPGCCDPTLGCQSGKEDQRCGKGGEECATCPADHACAIDPASPEENPFYACVTTANCKHGCLIEQVVDGVIQVKCFEGDAPNACGSRGASCNNCKNNPCQDHVCLPCGPPGCSTCCGADGTCHVPMEGPFAPPCGKNGVPCDDCQDPIKYPFGTFCSEDGVCVLCNETTCPKGCCDGNGACIPAGTSSSACGWLGEECDNCTNPEKYDPARICSAATGTCKPCGPDSCSTCCDKDGQCHVSGDTDFTCGTGGVACADCFASSEYCRESDKTCQPCGPDTCASGCCKKSDADKWECVAGFQSAACGKGGNICAECKETEDCVDNACVVPDAGTPDADTPDAESPP